MNYRNKGLRKLAAFCLLVGLLAGCASFAPGAVTSFPTQAGTDPMDATLTAVNVIAQKATDAAAMAQTLAAEPTDTPTPTLPPPTTQNCQSADLSTESRSNGATGSITFSVVLTNVGNRTCLLGGPPQVQLVTRQGIPLEVKSQPICFLCGQENTSEKTPSSATQEVLSPTQTAAAREIMDTPLGLSPGKAVKLFLIWYNYCEPYPPGGVMVRLALPPGGQLDILTDAEAGGRCDAQDNPSTLMVSQFSYK
jgi:hypothetical protein